VTDEKRAYINQWLFKAEDDLKAYKLLINSEFTLFAIAAFHLQQSSEKYLKAYLEYHNKTFAKTHDIEYLLQLCAQINSVF
jgi:HEPN domain-containing protein